MSLRSDLLLCSKNREGQIDRCHPSHSLIVEAPLIIACSKQWKRSQGSVLHCRTRDRLALQQCEGDTFAPSDHVGFGSDYLGSENHTVGLESAAGLSAITHSLLQRGYSQDEIEKILGGNLLRVLEAVQESGKGPGAVS